MQNSKETNNLGDKPKENYQELNNLLRKMIAEKKASIEENKQRLFTELQAQYPNASEDLLRTFKVLIG